MLKMFYKGYDMATLKTSVLGFELENPFLLASSPTTARVESIEEGFEAGWAGAVLKTINPDDLEARDTSPKYATMKENGEIIGFQNIELLSHEKVSYWVDAIKYLKQKFPTKMLIASVMAQTERTKWQKLVMELNKTPLDAFELNFSCPHGMPEYDIGMAIGTNPMISKLITTWVKAVSDKPVVVKLTPNVTNISEVAKSVGEANADGLAAINTVQGFLGLNLDTLDPILSVDGLTTYGGCSGKIIKPIGLRCVSEMRKCSKLPIFGIGGISDWQDAAQYIAVGADAVQVCTEVMLNGHDTIHKLKVGLLNYLESKGMNDISELKNRAIPKIVSYEELNKDKICYPAIDSKKCILCKKCVKVCSESEYSALSKEGESIVLNKDKCKGCSLCAQVCTNEAIRMMHNI